MEQSWNKRVESTPKQTSSTVAYYTIGKTVRSKHIGTLWDTGAPKGIQVHENGKDRKNVTGHTVRPKQRGTEPVRRHIAETRTFTITKTKGWKATTMWTRGDRGKLKTDRKTHEKKKQGRYRQSKDDRRHMWRTEPQ